MWYNSKQNGGRVLPIITISRQPYSSGNEIAKKLSDKLGFERITREKLLNEFLPDVFFPHDLNMLKSSAKYYLKKFKNNVTFLDYIDKSLHEYTKTNSVILAGFGSQMIFADDKDALHFRVIAPRQTRINRIIEKYHLSEDEAEQILIKADKKQRRFVTTLFDADVTDPLHYDLVINTKTTTVEDVVTTILSMIDKSDTEAIETEAEQKEKVYVEKLKESDMKNHAEIEFAKLLDMYHIAWKYEPKTFPIEWDAEGNVTSAFKPDFYLCDFDTYIELTTMNQKYVTQKNKKVKKLKKLYPSVNIKIVYKKDFHSLVERFNLNRGEK